MTHNSDQLVLAVARAALDVICARVANREDPKTVVTEVVDLLLAGLCDTATIERVAARVLSLMEE